MIETTQNVYNSVLALPIEERLELVDKLLTTFTPTTKAIEEAWYIEAERRLSAYRAGKIKAVPGDIVFKKIHKRLSR